MPRYENFDPSKPLPGDSQTEEEIQTWYLQHGRKDLIVVVRQTHFGGYLLTLTRI